MHSHPAAAAVLSRVTQRESDYKALSSPVESLTILRRTQKVALLARAAETPRGEQEKVGRLLFPPTHRSEARDTREKRGQSGRG